MAWPTVIEVSLEGLKARRLGRQGVLAGLQVEELITALPVADDGLLLAAGFIADCDDSGGDSSAGSVVDASAEGDGGLGRKAAAAQIRMMACFMKLLSRVLGNGTYEREGGGRWYRL